MFRCKNCRNSLFPVIGGSRCRTCSIYQLDDLFCEDCIMAYKTSDLNERICLICFEAYRQSRELFNQKELEDERSKYLPDLITVTQT